MQVLIDILVHPGFWIVLLSLLIYGVVHSWLASQSVKRLVMDRLGTAAGRGYRLFYTLQSLVTFVPVLIVLLVTPDQPLYSVPWPWAGLFLLIQAGGLALGAWSLLTTDLWAFIGLRQVAASRDSTGNVERLTVSGPYRFVRHPMYTASLLALFFWPWMTVNLLAFNLGTLAYFVIGGTLEERKLEQQFGQAYADYRKHTPMLLPWLL